MEILTQQNEKDNHHRIYYTKSDGQGYVFTKSKPLDALNAQYVEEGWLCSGPVWNRTFEEYISNYSKEV